MATNFHYANEDIASGDRRDSLIKAQHDLPEDWKWEWFTDVLGIQGGTQPPASTFVAAHQPGYVRLVQIRDFEADNHVTYIPDSSKWRRCIDTDVLIARYGAALGRICRGLSGAYNVALAKIVPSDEILNDFAYYLLQSDYFQKPILAGGDRSAQAGFNKADLAVIPLPIPPLSDQRVISRILGSLDDKIELNRRMSQTLEEIARTLFKSWFVDFDPVHAKAAGRQPVGMDAETASLFPSEFEESELGLIPKGWAVGDFSSIAVEQRNISNPNQLNPATPYIGLEHMPRRSIALDQWSEAYKVSSQKARFSRDDILFGKLRPYFHKVGLAQVDGVCSTDIMVIQPMNPEWHAFVLLLASSDRFVAAANAASTGTRMPRTNWARLSEYDIAMPPKEIASLFNKQVHAMLLRIGMCISENRLLAPLRDTLLPELLIGRLSI